MNEWRWWLERPGRILLGLFLVIIICVVLVFVVKDIVLPALSGLLVIIVLAVIIRFALTGRVGEHNGRH